MNARRLAVVLALLTGSAVAQTSAPQWGEWRVKKVVGGGGGSTELCFKTIDSPSGTDPVADSSTDTLTLICPAPMACTGDSAADSLTLAVGAATTDAAGVVELATSMETSPGLAVQASDTRLSDARTPSSHAASHASGAGDALSGTLAVAISGNAATASALAANGANCSPGQYPLGVDAAGAAEGCAAVSAATTDAAGIVELATSGESASGLAVQANDARLSDSRTPTAHAASHVSGAGDALSGTLAVAISGNAATASALAANGANCDAGQYPLGVDAAGAAESCTSVGGVSDHGALTGLSPDDDHAQYALLAGRSGGQTLTGSTVTAQSLSLKANAVDSTNPVVVVPSATGGATGNDGLRVGPATAAGFFAAADSSGDFVLTEADGAGVVQIKNAGAVWFGGSSSVARLESPALTGVGVKNSSGGDGIVFGEGATWYSYNGSATLTTLLRGNDNATGSTGSRTFKVPHFSGYAVPAHMALAGTKALTDATATGIFEVALANNSATFGEATVGVLATDSTEWQAVSGKLRWSAVNKAGSITTQLTLSVDTASVSSGTLTLTGDILAGASKITIRLTADTSLTPTTLSAGWSASELTGKVIKEL